jgi:hypothetical protein
VQVLLDSLVFQATQAVLDYLVLKVYKVNLDYQDYQGILVRPVLLVYKGPQARMVPTLWHQRVISL